MSVPYWWAGGKCWIFAVVVMLGISWPLDRVNAMQFVNPATGVQRGGYELINNQFVINTYGSPFIVVPTPSAVAISGNVTVTGNVFASGITTYASFTRNGWISIAGVSPNALILGSSNETTMRYNKNQIVFDSSTAYGSYHSIRTNHSSTDISKNGIDFIVWAPGTASGNLVQGDTILDLAFPYSYNYPRMVINMHNYDIRPVDTRSRVSGNVFVSGNTFATGWYYTDYNAVFILPYDVTHKGLFLSTQNVSVSVSAFIASNSNYLSICYMDNTTGTFTPYTVLQNNGTWLPPSDKRLKKHIKPLPSILAKVMKLAPVTYLFTHDPDTASRNIGFIAQEVQPYFPELVGNAASNETGPFLTLNYEGFGVVAIKAIQEVKHDIDRQVQDLDVVMDRARSTEAEIDARLNRLERLMRK